jgi:hypothetical protein
MSSLKCKKYKVLAQLTRILLREFRKKIKNYAKVPGKYLKKEKIGKNRKK